MPAEFPSMFVSSDLSLTVFQLMKDLVAIFKILNVCADRISVNPVYVQPMLDLLQLCRFPFLKERASDETSYNQIAVESISQLGTCEVWTNAQSCLLRYAQKKNYFLDCNTHVCQCICLVLYASGYLLRVPNSNIRQEICKTLIDFHSEARSENNFQSKIPPFKPNSNVSKIHTSIFCCELFGQFQDCKQTLWLSIRESLRTATLLKPWWRYFHLSSLDTTEIHGLVTWNSKTNLQTEISMLVCFNFSLWRSQKTISTSNCRFCVFCRNCQHILVNCAGVSLYRFSCTCTSIKRCQ